MICCFPVLCQTVAQLLMSLFYTAGNVEIQLSRQKPCFTTPTSQVKCEFAMQRTDTFG